MNMLRPTLVFGCFAAFVFVGSSCGPSSVVLNHDHAGNAGNAGAPALPNETPAAGDGGSAPSGGSAAGGTAGSATGGTGGSTDVVLLVPNCDYVQALKSCTTLGCHAATYPAAGLNLVPDANLVARLKDVPARHEDISCTGPADPSCTCNSSSFTCSPAPSSCPAPGSALLVDSANYSQSWIITKLEQTDPGCGIQMPDGAYRAPGDKSCIEQLVQAIAALP